MGAHELVVIVVVMLVFIGGGWLRVQRRSPPEVGGAPPAEPDLFGTPIRIGPVHSEFGAARLPPSIVCRVDAALCRSPESCLANGCVRSRGALTQFTTP
jgi:hypothetical protein